MNKDDMLQQLQNLLGLKNDLCEKPEETESIAECIDELAEMFCDGAVILSRIADQLQGETDPWANSICTDNEDDEYDGDDFCDEDAIVLYTVPGMPVTLVDEECAIDELMINFGAKAFSQTFITEDLMAVYPTKYAYESANVEGMVFVAGPMYICHVIAGDEDAKMDLTAEDFCQILSFINDHTVPAKDKSETSGFLFEKED